jgi:hypothetical protein
VETEAKGKKGSKKVNRLNFLSAAMAGTTASAKLPSSKVFGSKKNLADLSDE